MSTENADKLEALIEARNPCAEIRLPADGSHYHVKEAHRIAGLVGDRRAQALDDARERFQKKAGERIARREAARADDRFAQRYQALDEARFEKYAESEPHQVSDPRLTPRLEKVLAVLKPGWMVPAERFFDACWPGSTNRRNLFNSLRVAVHALRKRGYLIESGAGYYRRTR